MTRTCASALCPTNSARYRLHTSSYTSPAAPEHRNAKSRTARIPQYAPVPEVLVNPEGWSRYSLRTHRLDRCCR